MRISLIVLAASTVFSVACSQSALPTAPTSVSPATPSSSSSAPAATMTVQAQASRNQQACWGEATQVFAQLGDFGAHASQQATPRLGLRNVARALYEQGLLPDDSLQALGAFLSAALELSIDSCL